MSLAASTHNTDRNYAILLKKLSIALSFVFLSSINTELSAQDNVGDDSTVIYPASYFSEYSPVTALDMINRIPGMSVGNSAGGRSSGGSPGSNAGRGGRGFGGGGGGTQIMINGKRTAGKNNNSQTQLVRINADQVDYIELIRGTGGDLDVRGGTQVANVVLYEQLSDTSISYEANGAYYDDGQSEPGGSLSYGGQSGDLNFLFSAVAEPRYEHRLAKEISILGDLSLNDQVREERIREQTSFTLSTNLDYQISEKSSARFNALYAENDDPTEVDRLTIDLLGGANTPSWEREDIPGTKSNWEIGGDYEYQFNNGSRFKTLFISNENDNATTRERFDVLAGGGEEKNLYLNMASVLKERIVRGSYTMDLFDGQDLEIGIERAQTILDSNLRLGLAGTGLPSASHGGLVPEDISNANTNVEEIRYEPFAIHNWRINSRMSLETSLVYETSEIEQTGDLYNKRDFNFFRPKLDYRFDITPQLQLRALFEKIVRQISFSDFVAATDSDDNDSNTLAGNADLRPDYWWNYNLLAEYRLPSDAGVVSANLYKHEHRDFRQRIDVSTSDTDLRSAAGNVGSGEMWVAELKASVRLNMLSMPNVLLTTLASRRTSSVTDPFLGIDREFDNYHKGEFNLSFRHDIPQWRMNWGMNMINRLDGTTKRWDIIDIEEDYSAPYVTAFAELIALDDITFRLDIRNVTDVFRCRDRTRFVGHIRDNILEEIETNCFGSGRVFSLKMSGTF